VSASGGLSRDAVDPGVNAAVVDQSTSSGNVANTPAVATLAAVANRTTYITGFVVTGLGATAAGTVDITVTGPTNTLHFVQTAPAGATVPQTPLVVTFPRPIPAAAVNTAIVVTVPAFGAGNVSACVTAFGYTSN